MILFLFVSFIRIVLSQSVSRPLLLKAVVGELFFINNSFIHQFGFNKNLPYWLCQSSSEYRGIPMTKDQGIIFINDHLSVNVTAKPIVQYNIHCIHRWPTVIVLLTDKQISKLSGCERLRLWDLLQKYLPGLVTNLKLEENVDNLMKSLSVLAQWKMKHKGNNYKLRTAVLSYIGCGSIPEDMIENLKYMEKDRNVNHLTEILSFSIRKWIVADLFDPIIVRRRHKRTSFFKYTEYSSTFYQQEKQQKEKWNEAEVITEGSGEHAMNWSATTDEDQKRFTNEIKNIPSSTKSLPIIKENLKDATIYVGFKQYYKIPPNTFYDAEDGHNRNMKMKVYLSSKDMRGDQQIFSDPNKWIYFNESDQTVFLIPGKSNAGQYDLTVCVFDSDMNRICDEIKLVIRRPKTVTETVHKTAPPGVLWTYRLPPGWADKTKHSPNDVLKIRVQSLSLVEWQQNEAMISLITEAFVSKEHKIRLRAESQTTGKILVWIIIVTVASHNTYTEETSSEIIVKVSPQSFKKVSFKIINILKDKLTETISRFWSTTSRDILLYKIVSGSNAFLTDLEDSVLVLSFVYSPKTTPSNFVNCSNVIILEEMVDSFKVNLLKISTKNIKKIELLDLIEVPGKCMSPKVQRNTHKISTTPYSISLNPQEITIPDLLNKTINLAVHSGLTFKKIIVPTYQPEFKLIRLMELFDNNNLLIDESSWVFLSSTQFEIFGLPLLENVRSEPYSFRLKVTLNSGRTQLVSVNIVVEKFVPLFNHKFGLIISISEKDTLELDRPRHKMNESPLKTMGQLLIGQTLSYRWQVVQTIADYLYAKKCISDCGTNIFIHNFSEPKSWQVNISWSVVFNSAGSPEFPTIYSVTSCSDDKLKSYIRSLIMVDSMSKSIISMSSFISIFQAHPHKNLIKAFKEKYLGTPTLVNIESSGSCSSSTGKANINSSGVVLWSNLSVYQGTIFTFVLETEKYPMKNDYQNLNSSKIFYQNGSLCKLEWVKLSQNGRIIYGLPLLSDGEIQSYFALRILLEFGEAREKLKYFISLALKSSRHFTRKTHLVNMTLSVRPKNFRNIKELEYRIRIARKIIAYLRPRCSLLYNPSGIDFQFLTQDPYRRPKVESCEKADDIILHSISSRVYDNETFIDIVWNQVSVSVKENSANLDCNATVLQDLSNKLFHNHSSSTPNQELTSFFQNSEFGSIFSVKLYLFNDCLDILKKENISIVYDLLKDMKSQEPSQASTKVVLVVLFFLFIIIVSVIIVIYFVKKGLPTTFTRLTDKTNKSVALDDFTPTNKNPLKSPKSSFNKKMKNNANLDSLGPSPLNNSPKTPLLSQFSKEESKSEKQKEPIFNDEEATGSFTYAARHPQSPEPPDMLSNKSLGISKQPATSNVIRNPAMMMGSRLNPYRNIPPPIV